MTNSDSPKPIPIWRFWVPLLFQTVLTLAVPAQAVYIQMTGKTVILQTAPVDPYELLRGYSQRLNYDISSQDNLRSLPGWAELPKQESQGNEVSFIKPGTRFYITLQAPAVALAQTSPTLPQAWKPVAVSADPPPPPGLPANQVTLKGLAQYGSIQYGLETYYIPEDQREQINADLEATVPTNSNQPQQAPPVVMEIKVNTQGDAVPIGFWVKFGNASSPQIRNYRF